MSRVDHSKIVAAVQHSAISSRLRLSSAQHRSRVLKYGRRVVLSAILLLFFSTAPLIVRTTGESDSWLRTSISAATRFLNARRDRAANEVLPAYVLPAMVTAAPTNLIPASAATTQISLSWTAASGTIDHYEVERSLTATGVFSFLNSSFSTSFNDNAVTSGSIYRYRVRAVDGAGVPSAYSNVVFAMAVNFTDNPIAIGVTTIKAQHLTELRQDINALRQYAGLSAATWTDATLTGVTIKAVHFQELRDRLGEALTALNMTSSAYTDPTLTAGTTTIKATHLDELRQRVSRGVSSVAGGGPTFGDLANSRLDPMNATGGGGENPLSRNFNWSLPLVGLPGRAGLDLSLNLSYNSLVWTRNGSYISFDDDGGFPGPGFHLGFPVIQSLYYNAEAGKYAYLLISSDGSRTELRQVATNSVLFESADSSHLLLDTTNLSSGDPSMLLRTTDGTQLTYALRGSGFQCTQIKDRNGNYITISYTSFGRVDIVTDTLNRTIKFNYDASNTLTSITQTWTVNGSSVTHTWASFEYRNPNLTISTTFTGLTMMGVSNGSSIKVLSRVTLADNSRFEFDYTSWGQVWKISAIANDGQTLLNYRSYNLPPNDQAPQMDCPRFTLRRDWAKFGNRDVSGTEQEAITSFIEPANASWTMPDGTPQSGTLAQVTGPDGTYDRIYSHSSGWDKGLPLLTETYDSSQSRQRQIATAWTQDNTSLTVPLNPCVTETNTYDPQGNRKLTRITYHEIPLPDTTSCSLPQDVFEYKDANTILRSTRTTYNENSAYTSRRIIGLVSQQAVYDGDVNAGGILVAKVGYQYDETGSIQGSDAPVQHDDLNFVVGRGNLSSAKRYDVNDSNQLTTTTTSTKYNTAGAIVSMTDASGHTSQISYVDAFSDNVARNTLAYPTRVTDPDGYYSTSRYNFDFGALTYRQNPPPNFTGAPSSQPAGPEQTFTYDLIGRLERTTSLVNSAYTRYIYGPNYVRTYSTVNTVADEAYSLQIFDGAGRVIATARNHPGSTGGFSAQLTVYDAMGRAIKESNPTETSITVQQPATPINPFSWTATGDDATAGWIYTQQTYDWKGRPLVTTNQDGTTKSASYAGCGCAGGEVVTLTDEGTLDGGVVKRRQQKIYSDVLGRPFKTEILNWEGGSVYSATVTTYNVRDQVTQVRQYAGPEGSPTYQDTTTGYDGYGRLQTKHVPDQNAGTTTSYAYMPDDTVLSITDARGAGAAYAYNGRHLVTDITYSAPAGIAIPAAVAYGYDGAGNRSWMNENNQRRVTYHYDMMSRMDWEDRQFPGLSGDYRLSYEYNLAGQLKSVIDPTNSAINYVYDPAGRITSVGGTPYGTGGINGTPYIEISQYASELKYRAWGALKSLTYGNQMTHFQGYDQRLRLSSFLVAGMTPPPNAPPGWETRLMSADFQYYADDSLRSASDNLKNEFDRAYSYDHVKGPKEAYSGSEARDFLNGTNSGPPTGPYRQSYQYDVFGNMTGRTSRFWSQTDSFTGTYSNNRRQGVGFNYDADGNLTQDTDFQYTYDAAGRSASIFNAATNKTISPIYDGDGQVVHRTEVEEGSAVPNFFQLRSTVMGGKVITELDSQGQKKKGYVYCNGVLIARQEYLWIVWQHDNPFTGTRGASNRDGVGSIDIEADPMGIDTESYDPYVQPELWEPPSGGVVGLLPGSGVPSGRCTLDGMAIECREAVHLLQMGAAEFEHPTTVWDNGGWHFVNFNRETGQYEARVFSHYDNTSVTIDGRTSGAWHPVFKNVVVGARTGSSLFWLFGQNPMFVSPQKIRTIDLQKQITLLTGSFDSEDEAKVRNAVEHLLSEKCDDAFQAAGLATPASIIFKSGIVLGAATLLMNSANNSSSGITEYARRRDLNAVGSTGIQAFTIRNHPGKTPDTTDERARIFLNRSAFSGGVYSLQDVITHEFMHVAGMEAANVPIYGSLIRQHDLSYVKNYDSIIEACK